jgi:hypothetical protein
VFSSEFGNRSVSQMFDLGFTLLSFQSIQKDFQKPLPRQMIQLDSLTILMKDSAVEVTCFVGKACNSLRQECSRIIMASVIKHSPAVAVFKIGEKVCLNVTNARRRSVAFVVLQHINFPTPGHFSVLNVKKHSPTKMILLFITVFMREKNHTDVIVVMKHSQMLLIFMCINVFTHHSSVFIVVKHSVPIVV